MFGSEEINSIKYEHLSHSIKHDWEFNEDNKSGQYQQLLLCNSQHNLDSLDKYYTR